MYINKKNKISALAALVLFYLCPALNAGLPLTETIYTIPEGEMTLSFREEIVRLDSDYRKENYSIGIGFLRDLSAFYSLEYLHDGLFRKSSDILGDSFLKIWLYIGDYSKILHAGLLLSFRIPTGPDAYAEIRWRNLSLGKDELKIGPVLKIDMQESVFLHFNLFYVFRQGENEGFYDGFYFNPTKKETYKKLFGLNFRSKDTFLSGDRLKNDYAICSVALNTDLLYPKTSLIPFIELYVSHRVYKKQSGENANIPIEGSAINPVLLSFGLRYFFSESAFFGVYYIFNPKREKNYIKDIFGFDFSLQF